MYRSGNIFSAKKWHSILLAPAFLGMLCCVTGAYAQVQTTTSIEGVITDPSGSVVPNASVTVKEENTGVTHSGVTNASGSYSFPSLLPGTYIITVTHPGFQTAVITNRLVQAAQSAHVDVTLQVGSTTTAVTVSAAGAELMSTTSSQISSIVSPRLVQSIPLNGLDYFDLAALAPGAVPQNTSTRVMTFAACQEGVEAGNTFLSTGIMLGGNRDSGTNVSIDGVNTQSPLYEGSTQIQSPYDVQELQMEMGTMNAEFGNGVSAVNVITKSGTNAYHGQIYEYFRNNNLDATPFFTNLEQQSNPFYDQNQFGFTLGGPIKKDKLFFFVDYEGYRLVQDATSIEDVPSVALRNGDFSQFQPKPGKGVPTIYNPYQSNPQTGLRTPFAGNVIPLGATSLCSPQPTCVNPVDLKFLQNWVLPPNGTFNGQPAIIEPARTVSDRDQGTARVDWAKSERATFYTRFTDYAATSFAGGAQPLEGGGNPMWSKQAMVNWTESVSSSAVNDLMLGYSRPIFYILPNTSRPDVDAQIGLKNSGPGPGGPEFTGTEFTLDPTEAATYYATDNKIQLKDDFSWSKGRHSFKLGGEVINDGFFFVKQGRQKGAITMGDYFSSACPEVDPTCTAALRASALSSGGDPFADYLLGGFSNATVQIKQEYAAHQNYYGLYAQDSWRATRKLTLNYGLRYEYWAPWLLPNNTAVSFNFQTGNIEYALQNPLDYLNPQKCFGACAPLNPAIPREGYKIGSLNFAPRLGLAYNPIPNIVVRAGFGVYFDGNANNNQVSDEQAGAAPFNFQSVVTPDLSLETPQLLVGELFPPSGPTSIPTPRF